MNGESLDLGQSTESNEEEEQQTRYIRRYGQERKHIEGVVHLNFTLLLHYMPQNMIPSRKGSDQIDRGKTLENGYGSRNGVIEEE